MRTVTIISDWKKADYYMAVLQGIFLSGGDGLRVVEMTHQVESYKVEQAVFILRSSYRYYPDGTIHLVAVKAEPDNGDSWLACMWENQFFIFPDNGFATLFWSDKVPELYAVENIPATTFPEALVMAEAALQIHRNNGLQDMKIHEAPLLQRTVPMPWFEDNVITGAVIHTDSYGNAITNISRDYFEKLVGAKKFLISPGNSYYPINNISAHYRDVSVPDQMALFNLAGWLEIAIRNGSARDLLGLKEGTNIRIEIL
jgi:hypothetical protein